VTVSGSAITEVVGPQSDRARVGNHLAEMRLRSMSRALATVAAVVGVLLAGGCGGSSSDIRLTIALGTVDRVHLELGERRFELRCNPAGGTIQRAEEICFLLEHDPSLLDPPATESTCAGSLGIPPGVTVRGVANGRRVDLAFRCDGPEERTRTQAFWYSAVLPGGESG
jgi:hypothetical protein